MTEGSVRHIIHYLLNYNMLTRSHPKMKSGAHGGLYEYQIVIKDDFFFLYGGARDRKEKYTW